MPNRIIKESITTSDTLDQLSAEEERFFYRLIVKCDDFGRFDARPTVLRAACFPLKIDDVTDSHVADWLNALAKAGLVMLYEHHGRPYLQVVTWKQHQQQRAAKSKYPNPDDSGCAHLQSIDIKCPRIRERDRIRDTRPTDENDAHTREVTHDPTEPDREDAPDSSVGQSVGQLGDSDELPPPSDDMAWPDVTQRYHRRLGMLGPSVFSRLEFWHREGLSAGAIVAGIEVTAQAKAEKRIRGHPDRYLDGVLRGMFNDGVRTVADIHERAGPQTDDEWVNAILAEVGLAERSETA